MTTRDLTDKFIKFRISIKKSNEDIPDIIKQENKKIDKQIDKKDDIMESIINKTNEIQYKEYFENIKSLCNELDNQLDYVKKIYLKNTFGDESIVLKEIAVLDTIISKINRLFKDKDIYLQSYNNKDNTNLQTYEIIKNMYKYNATRFQKQIETIQDFKTKYLNLNKINSKKDDISKSDDIADIFNQHIYNKQQEQIEITDEEYHYETERQKEIIEFVQSLNELKDMYIQFSNIVSSSKFTINKIEKTIDESLDKVKKGTSDLEQAKKSNKCIIM